MVDIAARATNGVKIPGRKATRTEIMRMFKDHWTKLKKKLNVRRIDFLRHVDSLKHLPYRVMLSVVL
jgi:hypothetical protein